MRTRCSKPESGNFCNLSPFRQFSNLTVTDEQLMQAVRDGDVSRLGLLFERHHLGLFDFLSRMTGNPGVAEDLVQDVFVRVLKYRATFRDEGRFDTWLYRIARNARVDYFRSRRPIESIEDAAMDIPQPGDGPAETVQREREVARLRRALLLLREDKRELIVLARYRAMRHEQIAELLGIEAGAVKVRLHRAVRELRDIFLELPEEGAKWNAKQLVRGLQIV
jgi:RNA polymerase sigma factor (sigma-70 family)